MGKLVYSMSVSLDGFVETPAHRVEFDGELSVGGPTIASVFVRAGLVDDDPASRRGHLKDDDADEGI